MTKKWFSQIKIFYVHVWYIYTYMIRKIKKILLLFPAIRETIFFPQTVSSVKIFRAQRTLLNSWRALISNFSMLFSLTSRCVKFLIKKKIKILTIVNHLRFLNIIIIMNIFMKYLHRNFQVWCFLLIDYFEDSLCTNYFDSFHLYNLCYGLFLIIRPKKLIF